MHPCVSIHVIKREMNLFWCCNCAPTIGIEKLYATASWRKLRKNNWLRRLFEPFQIVHRYHWFCFRSFHGNIYVIISRFTDLECSETMYTWTSVKRKRNAIKTLKELSCNLKNYELWSLQCKKKCCSLPKFTVLELKGPQKIDLYCLFCLETTSLGLSNLKALNDMKAEFSGFAFYVEASI